MNLLFSFSGHAQEIFEYHTGVRQLGMGGAYAAVVNDETALLSNPAGLGKLRGFIGTIADPELSLGGNTTDIATASTYTTVLSPQGLLDALNNQRGKHFHAKAQVFPSAVFSNFGIGIHAKYQTDAEVDATGTDFNVTYYNDVSAVLGYNFRFFDGRFKLGFVSRFVDRTELVTTLPANSTGLTLNSISSEGFGVAVDAGLMIAAPVQMLPTLAIVVRDAGHTTYKLSDGLFNPTSTRPRTTEQTVDVGLAVFPIVGNHIRTSFTIDYHNVLTMAKDTENGGTLDVWRRGHVGMEINVHDFFFLRGGLNQRYWSAGFEVSTQRFQIQGASYGEEIGTSAVPREDRRYVGKFSIRF